MKHNHARWQYPLISVGVAANALLAFQGQDTLTSWKLGGGAVWLVAAACLGYAFALREERLSTPCELDPLTGLFNRRHFEL